MKFSIRDLLLVTVIVAVCVAWWLDRSRLAAENKRLRVDHGFFGQAKSGVIDWVPNSSEPAPNPATPTSR